MKGLIQFKRIILLLALVGVVWCAQLVFADVRVLPIRSTFEGIGFKVGWLQSEQAITIEKDLIFVKLQKGSQVAWINGNYEKLLKPVRVENGVSYTDESLLALLFEDRYGFSAGKVILKPGATPNVKYALPVVGTETKLRELMPFFESGYNRMELEGGFFPAPVMTATSEGVADKSNQGFSSTNVQVAGIDEADRVKTDGNYIYTIREGGITIVDTRGSTLKEIVQLKDETVYYSALYLHENQLLALGTKRYSEGRVQNKEQVSYIMPYYRTQTALVAYDLTQISSPKVIKTFVVDGNLLSSRLSDDALYMVTNRTQWGNGGFYPTIQMDDEAPVSFGPERIHYFPDTSPTGMMMTVGFDLTHLSNEPHVQVYLSQGEIFYMSAEHLYLAQTVYDEVLVKTQQSREKTRISKYALDHGRIVYSKSVDVEGRLLNQWAMDEYEGNLRLALHSSIGFIGDDSTTSRIEVYSDTLEILGKTENLAKGEKIYAVRFMGDMAYMVTFKTVDPFFAIDCSNPKEPDVLGYLKIPGYSEYLHPLSETKILGIGRSTLETQNGVTNNGLKLTVFDTSIMEDIRELDTMTLGEGSSSSEVLYDHKSFMIQKDQRRFAIPVNLVVKNSVDGQYFLGAYIFKYGEDYSLEVVATLQHNSTSYQGTEPIRRILYIQDTLYAVSDNQISALSGDSLEVINHIGLQ